MTFLSGKGIGNEIAFYIFDYPPEENCASGSTSRFLLDHIPKQQAGLRVNHVNLFDFVIEYLRHRKLLDKAIQMQKEKGDAFVLKQFSTLAAPQQNRSSLCRGGPARPA